MTTNESDCLETGTARNCQEGDKIRSYQELDVTGISGETVALTFSDALEDKIKQKYSKAEKLLLPIALVIGILCDRLLFAPISRNSNNVTTFAGVFWLCYLAFFYGFYWKKLINNRVLWFVAGCSAALCVWNFFFSGKGMNSEFSLLTNLVIPAALMIHAQYLAGDYNLKDAGKIAFAYLFGWFSKPFSGIPALFGATGALFSEDNKSNVKKVALGTIVTVPILCVIIPLLSGADQIFRYYLERIVGIWNFGSIFWHTILVIIAFMLFYSFLWNVGFGTKGLKVQMDSKSVKRIDTIICFIVLGSISVLYAVFCTIQFTYLFAGAGLPDGLTYSEYAREGFAQTVTVCAINLFLFGIFLQFGTKKKVVTGFLTGLLALTSVMLISGAIRLRLYIGAYGLTWLRFLSAWFVLYLAAVVIICAVRMLREKLPAVSLCALLLLGWYVVLGYSNPEAFIERYNYSNNYGYYSDYGGGPIYHDSHDMHLID